MPPRLRAEVRDLRERFAIDADVNRVDVALAAHEELMRVVNMLGDTNVEAVRYHHFNFQYEEDDEQIDGWELPLYDRSDGVRHASLQCPTLSN